MWRAQLGVQTGRVWNGLVPVPVAVAGSGSNSKPTTCGSDSGSGSGTDSEKPTDIVWKTKRGGEEGDVDW